MDSSELIYKALKPENHASFGLKFLLEHYHEVFKSSDGIMELLTTIINIATNEEPAV